MKKQGKKNSSKSINIAQCIWYSWLQKLLTQKEYVALVAFNHLRMEGACVELGISRNQCSRLLKSGLKKLSIYYRFYLETEQNAKIHILTRREFIRARIEDIGFSTRTYHLLKSSDITYMFEVLRRGTKGLYQIRGFGETAMIELKSILKYKGCTELLE